MNPLKTEGTGKRLQGEGPRQRPARAAEKKRTDESRPPQHSEFAEGKGVLNTRGTRGEGRPEMRGTETNKAPAHGTRTEAERVSSAVQ